MQSWNRDCTAVSRQQWPHNRLRPDLLLPRRYLCAARRVLPILLHGVRRVSGWFHWIVYHGELGLPKQLLPWKRRGCCQNPTQCSYAGSGYQCNFSSCTCQSITPIIVDTTGKGFHLTPPQDGVVFDFFGDNHPIRIAWTAASSGNAFLALDRNGNGKVDNAKELFGNITEQPISDNPNGYLALAEFDKPENGGNGDGIIDHRDVVFSHLLLWIDENHDGISQPRELHTLPELGVHSMSLHYRANRYFFDQYGNWFRYQAALNPGPRDTESEDGRVTYDVFFKSLPSETGLLSQPPISGRCQVRSEAGAYTDLALFDAIELGALRVRRGGCPSFSGVGKAGGAR